MGSSGLLKDTSGARIKIPKDFDESAESREVRRTGLSCRSFDIDIDIRFCFLSSLDCNACALLTNARCGMLAGQAGIVVMQDDVQ